MRVAGEKAKLDRVWPHMLRHSCGFYLTGKGTDMRVMQDYLGHKDPKHTAHYTRVAGRAFEASGDRPSRQRLRLAGCVAPAGPTSPPLPPGTFPSGQRCSS